MATFTRRSFYRRWKMRKVYLDVKMRLVILTDEDVKIQDVIEKLDCVLEDRTGKANVTDWEIEDFEITNSK